MFDHTIPKPVNLKAYAIHRMATELCSGSPCQFIDRVDHFVVRTDKEITNTAKKVIIPDLNSVIAFELRTSVSARRKNKNIYPVQQDWRFRREWLEKQGLRYGFQILAVHVNAKYMQIESSNDRKFWIDCSEFTGILKVTDTSLFSEAINKGIGRIGKAFGMGMLVI